MSLGFFHLDMGLECFLNLYMVTYTFIQYIHKDIFFGNILIEDTNTDGNISYLINGKGIELTPSNRINFPIKIYHNLIPLKVL